MKINIQKLNKRFFPLLVVALLLVGSCLPIRVNAAYDPTKPIDYTELDYSVKYGTEYNQVSVSIPSEYYYHNVYVGDNSIEQIGGDTFVFTLSPGQTVGLYEYPAGYRGLSLDNIPVGSKLVFDFYLSISAPVDPSWTPRFYQRYHYADLRGNWLGNSIRTEISGSLSQSYTIEYTVESVENAYAFVPSIAINNWGTYSMSDLTATVVMEDVRLVMDISADYWSKWQAGQNGKMLGEIKEELGNVNENLGDVKDELGNVNDKLDDTNDKLEALPGEIGDEMQGVIDNEKAESESSGNKFVNQILDKLPDPSTEVLSSLKGLTDSMAYTGTDCKLKIPALVIPAIDGLIPETEIWGGTEFSFSEYLSFLSPALLTVVQSLFTIAIVLFCVYELKGIISYCLTLNDKKGG